MLTLVGHCGRHGQGRCAGTKLGLRACPRPHHLPTPSLLLGVDSWWESLLYRQPLVLHTLQVM